MGRAFLSRVMGRLLIFTFDGVGRERGVENGVLGFCWVRYEEAAVKVLYCMEFCVGKWI